MRARQLLIRFLLFPVLLSVLSGCSDYQQGYQDGYNNQPAMSWLVLGAAAYAEGYNEGQMQIFHDDWYAENEAEIDEGRSCPALVAKLSPVVSLEAGRIIDLDREFHL